MFFLSFSSFGQFRYNLGKILLTICKGRNVGNTILLIADLMNHGKEFIQKHEKDLSLAITELNINAGKKALDGFDHKSAYSYLQVAVSFLPENHWESHYDLSLRLSFLVGSAANSSCKVDEAELILRRIIENARCLDDKLPSYFLLSQSKCVMALDTFYLCMISS